MLLASASSGCSGCSENPAALDGAAEDGSGNGESLQFPDGQRAADVSKVKPDFTASADDWDGDGLTNAEEQKLGTDPWSRDSDGDSKDDKAEVGGDATKPTDSDGDGRADALEPSDFDTDGDKVNDDQDKEDHDGPCGKPGRLAIMATLEQSVTLTKACSPYRVEGFLRMVKGATLTVEAGVQILFGPGAELAIGDATSKASLVVSGTAAEPVVLTTRAASPAKGAWRGVVIEDGEAVTLNHAVIEWAGATDPSLDPEASLLVKSASELTLTSVTFRHGKGHGLHAAAAKAPPPLFKGFTGCTFTDLDSAARLNIDHLGEIGDGNSFGAPGAGGEVQVNEGVVSAAATWKGLSVPYVLSEATLTVDADLTLQAGATVVLPAGAIVNVGYNSSSSGSLSAVGTSTGPVTFTTASPAAGSWQGIVLDAGKSALAYTSIIGAGAASWESVEASVYVSRDATLTPSHVTIKDGLGTGVYFSRNGGACSTTTTAEYTFTGTFTGTTKFPGCKVVCVDDANASSNGVCLAK